MTMVSLEGLQSGIAGEERALAILKVVYKGETYDWQLYIPPETNLADYIDAKTMDILAEIDRKEAEWAALDPKTRTYEDPFTGETVVQDIQKSEIVRPDIPDYYAKRRAEYPALGDQIDALWKGGTAMNDMFDRILAVKQKYPKP